MTREDLLEAVKAGDMAAFITLTRELDMEDRDASPLFDAFIVLDEAAAGRIEEAERVGDARHVLHREHLLRRRRSGRRSASCRSTRATRTRLTPIT